jgi:hypothetical protein
MKIYRGLPGLFSLIEDISGNIGSSRRQIADSETAEEKLKIEFCLTHTGDLLRRNRGKWELFSKECRRWQEYAFGIVTVLDSLPVSPQEAGEIVKYILKTSRK